MGTINLNLDLPGRTQTELESILGGVENTETTRELLDYLLGVNKGAFTISTATVAASIVCEVGTPAVAQMTFSGAPAQDGTVLIGPVTLVARTAPATVDQFLRGTNAATASAGLIAGINAHPILSTLVTASAGTAGQVLVTSKIGGTLGTGLIFGGTATNQTNTGFAQATASTRTARGL